MKTATKHIANLAAAFMAGLFAGTIALATFSFAMPIREFGSGYGTFVIWFGMLIRFYVGAFVLAVVPLLLVVTTRFPRMSFKKKSSMVAAVFVIVDVAKVVSIRAYDYWFVAIPFGLIAIIASLAIVATQARWPYRQNEKMA